MHFTETERVMTPDSVGAIVSELIIKSFPDEEPGEGPKEPNGGTDDGTP